MRATLQNKPSIFGFRLHIFLDFSEEEKAIIRTRALGGYVFDLSPGYLSTFKPTRDSLATIISISIFLFVAGMILTMLAAFFRALEPIALFALFGGPFLFVASFFMAFSADPAKQITLGYMVNNPHLIIAASEPGTIPTVEQNIQARLLELKHFLTQTHGLVTRRTIEL